MSEKKAKKFRKEFIKVWGRSKSLGDTKETRNVKKRVTLTEQRRAKRNMIADEKRLPKEERRPWDVVLTGLPQAGTPYLKKSSRIVSDETRRQYQADKKLFKSKI